MIGTKKDLSGVVKRSTFRGFLTCKCIFDFYEHRKFEYVSEPYWGIQVCEKI